jgi:transcriptional regulator with XRE-family HTH domain
LQFGGNIRKIRLLKNIKQQTIAKQLGISIQAYSKIERNDSKVSESRLMQISLILKVEVNIIKNFDEEKYLFSLQKNIDPTNTKEVLPSIDNKQSVNELINTLPKLIETMTTLLKNLNNQVCL